MDSREEIFAERGPDPRGEARPGAGPVVGQPLYRLAPIEPVVQVLAAALLAANFWHDVDHRYLQFFFWSVAGINAARLLIFQLTRAASKPDPEEFGWGVNSLLMLGNAAAGFTWGNAPTALTLLGAAGILALPYLPVAVACVAVANLVGSLLRTTLFLSFAVPAVGVPLALAVWQGRPSDAGMWGLVFFVVILIAHVAGRLAHMARLYRQLSRGNSELLKKLAVARDGAIRDQQEVERANAAIKEEILERQRAEEKIRASEQDLRAILRDMQDTFFRSDEGGHIVRVSPSVQFLLGYSTDEIIGKTLKELFALRAEHECFMEELERRMGVVENHEVRLCHQLGHEVWASINAHYYSGTVGEIMGIEGVARDITEKKLAAEALENEKERLRVTLESIGDGVITINVGGVVEYVNPIAESMTGWSNTEANGKPLHLVMQLADEDGAKPVELPIKAWLEEGKRAGLVSPALLVHTKPHTRAALELIGAPMRDVRHGVIGAVLVFRDVTKLRNLAKQLTFQATHDALTGLINRVEFEKRVDQAIQSASNGEKTHVLCYLDMDQFKVVNDTCGHHAGDELLRQVTALLRKYLRESDTLARLGGDEFGVLFSGCPLEQAAKLAEKLRKCVDEYRFAWEGKSFRVGLSIGVVPITGATAGLTELLSAADAACYVAKERGRNYVHVYQPDDQAIAEHHGQMQWLQRIQRALDHDLFELYYQPIVKVDDADRDIAHGEILLRMIDDQRPAGDNLIMPSAFIPAAERYHLMPQVDRWVLRNAFHALLERKRSGNQIRMCAINLSGQSLGDLKILDCIMGLFRETGLSPKGFCFEITESAVIANLEIAKQFITRLKRLGCRFALDDFGSGLSSFGYLKSLPVDYVKLDGSLVRDIAANRVSQAMVHAINYVTHIMGMKSIAEFVETEAIMDALKAIAVDYAQGYGIAMPRAFAKAAVPGERGGRTASAG